MSSDIYEIAKLLLEKPGGRQTVVRLLAPVWPAVLDARAAGIRWAEIGQRLAQAGLRRADGQPFCPSTLTWVARRLSETPGRERRFRSPAQVHDPPPVQKSRPASSMPTTQGGDLLGAVWQVPDDLKAFMAEPPLPDTSEIDRYLTEKRRGKSES